MPSYQYSNSHRGDKTILRSSYLHTGITYCCKAISLYWFRAQGEMNVSLYQHPLSSTFWHYYTFKHVHHMTCPLCRKFHCFPREQYCAASKRGHRRHYCNGYPSYWRNFHHCLHRKLSFLKPPVPVNKISPTSLHLRFNVVTFSQHYSDVIMSTMTSQITSLTMFSSIIYSGADQRIKSKLRVTGLCVGNSPVTGEFPALRASNAENVSIWWRHHGLHDHKAI